MVNKQKAINDLLDKIDEAEVKSLEKKLEKLTFVQFVTLGKALENVAKRTQKL
jgi:hypothetical protein